MRPIRVMVVDDVSIIRRLVQDALSIDPEISVVGTAANGRDALEKIPALKPDLLVLDYEMPEMDGLETLVEVRKHYPGIRVVIFSSYTRHGAKVTLDALWFGADDYVTKARADNLAAATDLVRTQLVPKIKALCSKGTASPATEAASGPRAWQEPAPPVVAPRAATKGTASRGTVLAIGASTGGPKALARFIEKIPPDFSAPILIVQHMPPLFTKYLAERLATRAPWRCVEGIDGALLEPGTVWVAPGDQHMTVERNGAETRVRLSNEPPVHSCRPAVDPLFRSIADAYGTGALAVVLTGMGHDGVQGCRRVREAGGQVLAQDEASSVVWGMPGIVVREGLADFVGSPEEIAAEITQRLLVTPGRRRAPIT